MGNLVVNGTDGVVTKAIAAMFVVVIALVASRALQWPVHRVLGADDQRKVGGTIFQNIVRVLVWGWATCAIIDICFDVDMAGVLGALGVVGIAVSLGAQQTIANIIGGIIISLSNMVGPGDWISVDGSKESRVVDTNWRRTTLEDEDGVIHVVPNSLMVSSLVEKGNPYDMIVVPFSVNVTVPDIEALLAECEQVVLDKQIECGMDWQAMRPKAHVVGADLGTIQAEMKIYAHRSYDTRTIERAVLPALVGLLQERDALAGLDVVLAKS